MCWLQTIQLTGRANAIWVLLIVKIYSANHKKFDAEYIWISLIANNSNILKCSMDDYLETTGGPLLF